MSMVVHEHCFHVRYFETDAMGVVHHSNYIRYFETARTEYLRAIGQDYKKMEADGIFCAIREVQCEYLYPARFNDQLYISVWVSQITPTRLYYRYEIISGGGKRICVGQTEHVFVNTAFAPVSLKKVMPEVYEALLSCASEKNETTSSAE